MAELYPLPFAHLVRRMFREFEKQQRIFDLPAQKFYRSHGGPDTTVEFCGMKAATPVGPAAGPQTQMAQNLVLSWLGGSRILELKTIQILDQLKISRPCIDMTNVGYNVEWSQELRLEQSLQEYVAGHMLIEMLVSANVLEQSDPFAKTATIFDVSVGYDLKGIQSKPVRDWLWAIKEATPLVEQLRQQIPREYAQYRDLPFKTRLAQSATLSTFHGCPAEEIESIVHFLITEMDYHVIIKMNPPMLGKEKLEYLFYDRLGYHDLEVNPKAYQVNITFDDAVEVVRRLKRTADRLGKTVGVKFSNTLEVINKGKFFSDEIMYLSGPPLHVLAMALVEDWRKVFGAEIPISFAAGIDQHNFADTVAAGLVPITTCSDLLKPGGYGRLYKYLLNLEKKMAELGTSCVGDYLVKWGSRGEEVIRAGLERWKGKGEKGERGKGREGEGENEIISQLEAALIENLRSKEVNLLNTTRAIIQRHLDSLSPEGLVLGLEKAAADLYNAVVDAARIANTAELMAKVLDDPRYSQNKNKSIPRKIDSHLALFDCINCDKCIPVCPNDANFYYELQPLIVQYSNYRIGPEGIEEIPGGILRIKESHQIANYADFCNECGNCDVFCPEHGGPYIRKPRFFSSLASWEKHANHNGFFVEKRGEVKTLWGRIDNQAYVFRVEARADCARFHDGAVAANLEWPSRKVIQVEIIQPQLIGHVLDMGICHQMAALLRGVLDERGVNYVNVAHVVMPHLRVE
jgi:putative selenate reductase